MIEINEKLIDQYKSLVYGLALTHVHNRYDADDVFQNVFLTLFQKQMKFENEAHLEGWLVKSTLNFCKKIHASSWLKKVVSLDSRPTEEFTFDEATDNIVFETLKKLPQDQKQAIYLNYFQGYSTKEIGDMLGVSDATIRRRISRGKKMMKGLLEDE